MNEKRAKKMGLKTLFSQKPPGYTGTVSVVSVQLVLYWYRLAFATFCTTCTGTG